MVGPAGDETYVEAELDAEPGETLAELKPADEDSLVVARRIFGDGRTRAYAWGRSAAREDVAAAAESAIAMSGQFQQRRLARPSFQLDVLDAFAGAGELRGELRTAWRELTAARRRHEELLEGAARAAERLEELHALVEATDGLEHGTEEDLRAQRERLLRLEDLLLGTAAAADALAPEDGDGAAALAARAERAVAPLESLAPELARAGDELRDVELRLHETASELRSFLATLGAEPGRLEEIEAGLQRIADARRRFGAQTYEELLARAQEANAELAALDAGVDPAAVAAQALTEADARVRALAKRLHDLRTAQRRGSPKRSRPSSAASASATASSRRDSPSASSAPPAPTRSSS